MEQGNKNEYHLLGYEEASAVITDMLITGDAYTKELGDLTLEIVANFPEAKMKPAEESVAVSARVLQNGAVHSVDELEFDDEALPGYTFEIILNNTEAIGYLLVYRK